VRAIAAVVLATLGALLAAFIIAEYEFEGYTPWLAAVAVGFLAGELVAGLGQWRGPAAMAVTGAIAAGALLYGQWLESDSGLEPWSQLAWGAAALAAGVAAWNVRPRPTRRTAPSS
jgi:hypothetical protein